MDCFTAVSTPRPYLPATADPSVRVGDREREKVIARLGQAFAQGYLPLPDYETRLNQAVEATTTGALNQVLGDLPVGRIARNDPARRAAKRAAARRGVHLHLVAFVAASLLMIGIWLAVALTAGAWYFWPVWPILGMGIGVVSHAVPVHRYLRGTGPTATG
ncbi:DUF1707 domain-containing protein [Candidatus Mycobacterium wuenschmannii]|uniref:DUF1707 domain-containing protein n=1 Tax=Candidatus Mycobacterium wuenschmannii TaxID=3027808 RepID=A0ABY8W3E7_9MYCO|nr:DUF1707 domain-containing protein [Candidatus Mycobacterium wuenschmannii]WIM90395.1 DUF1707 domain-containing protein [Candidatus Mycobacterium wuenschmannii]